MKGKNKISVKDLITIAIFSVILSLLFRFAAIISAVLPVLNSFSSAIGLLLCGTVWVCLLAKVPKKFCIGTLCIVISMLAFITGAIWTMVLGILAGGLIAEIINNFGKQNSTIVSMAAYAAFGIFFHFGSFGILFFFSNYWSKYASKIGVNEKYIDSVSEAITLPVFCLSCAAVVIGAILGVLLGRYILKKHFIKAGLV